MAAVPFEIGTLDLDMLAYDACLTTPSMLASVPRDTAEARALGLRSTPSFDSPVLFACSPIEAAAFWAYYMILRSPKTLQGDPAEHHGSLIDARVFIVLGLVAFSWEPTTGSQPPQPDAPKRFEIASIRPNKSGDRTSRADYKGETLTITNRRVRDIIRLAYGIGPYYTVPQATVEGEPQWVDDRYDIIAKTPGPVASGLPSGVLGFGPPLNVMLQALLAQRFRMVAHWETREQPGYALMLASRDGDLGSNIQPSYVDCDAYRSAVAAGSLPASPPRAPGELVQRCISNASSRSDGAYVHYEFSLGTQPIQNLVDRLARSLRQPVIDRTGLSGLFDVRLTYSVEATRAAIVASDGLPLTSEPSKRPVGPTLADALRDQLGLKLEARGAPTPVLVIDRLERPSEN